MTKTAVLSRFKETDNHWYYTLVNNNYSVIVYNKYSGANLINNVGRESHTYIHYIIQNYSNLPDEILFSQYDPKDHFIHASKEQRDDSVNVFLNSYLYNFIGIRPGQFPYTAARVRKVQWVKTCNKLFNRFTQSDVNSLISTGSTLNGIFRVSKNAILKRPLSFYKKCIKLLDYSSHPIEGYFFERIWRFLFTSYGEIDNIKHNYLIDYPLLYQHNNHISHVFNNTFGHIKLYSDGTIASNNICYHSHKNERFWQINSDTIFLFDYTGALTSKVYIAQDFPFKIDSYSFDKRIWISNNGLVKDMLMY